MAAPANSIREHDVVALLHPSGKWPPGTVGAVVSDYGDAKLIEIADERGVALDYVQVPASQLELRMNHGMSVEDHAFAASRGAWSEEEADRFSAVVDDAWSTWKSTT
jgi:hypothetical protein